ncbi:MAG: DUF3188 domain-containing protein [Cyanobacteria bacterium M_DeepCast_100m_m1_067]|nr:DUF3188 domain-containing protein [Cyanobacteria bacterium M_DeepCast_100m_m1_067]
MRRRPWLRGLLALSSPLLILLALLVLLQRRGVDRWPALPALLIGTGLLVTSALGQRRRRRELLAALRHDGGV